MSKVILSILFMLIASPVIAVELFETFPENIYPNEKYVFYSHGLIVEGTNPRPVHPEFGTYEFPQIKQAIFKDGDFNLVAHHRPENTNPEAYAARLISWVNTLIQAGVDPRNITLIGFSRGAQITAYVSNELNQLGINTVLMAVCFNGDHQAGNPIALGGDVLSIYESSDVVKSCAKILDRSRSANSTKEITISTGLRHGAFYTPLAEWLEPLKVWLSNNFR